MLDEHCIADTILKMLGIMRDDHTPQLLVMDAPMIIL